MNYLAVPGRLSKCCGVRALYVLFSVGKPIAQADLAVGIQQVWWTDSASRTSVPYPHPTLTTHLPRGWQLTLGVRRPAARRRPVQGQTL